MATTTNPAAVAEATGVAPDSARELQRATWALAWPVIFSFSIESFVGLCDMLMVGRLGPLAVAGVGVGVDSEDEITEERLDGFLARLDEFRSTILSSDKLLRADPEDVLTRVCDEIVSAA